MKSNNIQRGVGSSRREREIGDAPDLSRVARMPGAGESGGTRRRKRRRRALNPEDEMGKKRKTMPLSVMAALMAMALLLIGGALVMWIKPIMDRRGDMVEDTKSPYMPAALPEMPELTAPSEDQLRQSVTEALQVRDSSQVEKYFRLGSATPDEVVTFLSKMKETDGEVKRFDLLGVMDANRMPLEGFLVTFDKDGEVRNRLAYFTPSKSGDWKIDFPAFQRRADPDWNSFLEGSAKETVCRVYIALDTYYNGPFSDEAEWRCYGIASPDVERLMFGYCKRKSAQDIAMWKILQNQQKLARATLELGKVEGGGTRQFEIKHVLAEDWVKDDTAFEDK
ncbi:hypothetical protein JIN85_03660 [Luteolibacter pohnpeiensis]|uniref:Uncharacterized protein n=1 Tax=Luteolibacter pohnpeiensis TaxID=454153 RepID=A0A934VTH7_9BACT|nr:hypothetical protein [Luteolibacter pohnpeiensis]MBK1881497.1 hypothetical protein [Luteolibacter pohnpeiensis]